MFRKKENRFEIRNGREVKTLVCRRVVVGVSMCRLEKKEGVVKSPPRNGSC